jgi:hypothetical protein
LTWPFAVWQMLSLRSQSGVPDWPQTHWLYFALQISSDPSHIWMNPAAVQHSLYVEAQAIWQALVVHSALPFAHEQVLQPSVAANDSPSLYCRSL